MSLIKVVGIDLAKYVFSIHAVEIYGKCKLRKTIKRNKLLAEIANIASFIVAMEACSGAHYWAREFTKLGHDARIMASKFVIPYRQNKKMMQMTLKRSVKLQQDQKPALFLLKAKNNKRYFAYTASVNRTARINRLRGLLSEFGIVISQGRYPLQNTMSSILEDAENGLPNLARELLNNVCQSIREINVERLSYDRKLYALAQQMKEAKRLMSIPGIGEITATAVVATIMMRSILRPVAALQHG